MSSKKEGTKANASLASILKRDKKCTDDTDGGNNTVGVQVEDEAVKILNTLLENKSITLDEIEEIVSRQRKNPKQEHQQQLLVEKNVSINNNASGGGNVNVNGNGNGNGNNKRTRKKKTKTTSRNYITRHIALRFHYDGATYNGLAQNRNNEQDNSVEKVLFSALEKTCLIDLEEEGSNEESAAVGAAAVEAGGNGVGVGVEGILIEQEGSDNNPQQGQRQQYPSNITTPSTTKCINRNSRKECKYSRSGRTDKGVSAFGQVIALRVRSAFPLGTMLSSAASCTSTSTVLNHNHNNDEENQKYEETNSNDLKVMQESDLPKNSMEELHCWVPQALKKKKEPKNHESKDDNNKSMKSNNGNGNCEESNRTTSLKQRIIKEKNYCQMLNNVLPPTVRILGWSPVSQNFSARFSTSSRTYRYFFIQRDLNLDHMQESLDYMVGRHDFRNLCKMNCEEVDNFVRVVNYAKIIKTTFNSPTGVCTGTEGKDDTDSEEKCSSSGDGGDTGGDNQKLNYRRPCYFEIQGQAFLWHQIRCIASIIFMVGKGLESPTIVKELLDIETNPAKPCYPFAPELPLVLHKCDYKNLNFGHSVQNLWRVSCDLEKKWEELSLAAERLRNGLDSLETDSMVATCDVAKFINGFVLERKKKMERNCSIMNVNRDELSTVDSSQLIKNVGSHIPWGEALTIISKCGVGRPGVDGPKAPLHIPLMNRAKGTTYEEKVKAILATEGEKEGGPPSKRRREIYESNIKKKKLSKEEDESFYKKMLCEGGSGM